MGDDHPDVSAQGRRILVISNETLEGSALHEALRFRARNDEGQVLVVAPALTPRVPRRTVGDAGARGRLDRAVERLRAAGVRVCGDIGDPDPLQAIADALRTFPADEIVIATHPDERSEWLARDVVARARARFDAPVLHIVVDLDGRRPDRGRAARLAPTLTRSAS
jgi:GABA permease